MALTQLSVFVDNVPGSLLRVTRILAEHDIDIRALSLAETQNFGILRLIVNDPQKAGEALEANNIIFHFTTVVAVSVPDRPGGLAEILAMLANEGINIAYLYAFLAVSGKGATVVLRISSALRNLAIDILKSHGVEMLSE